MSDNFKTLGMPRCPECGAQGNKPCTTPDGHSAQCHASRWGDRFPIEPTSDSLMAFARLYAKLTEVRDAGGDNYVTQFDECSFMGGWAARQHEVDLLKKEIKQMKRDASDCTATFTPQTRNCMVERRLATRKRNSHE